MMGFDEVDERIRQIDDEVFKAETGQLLMSWDEYECRKVEAETLMKVLAESLASLNLCSAKDAYEKRQRIRSLDRIVKALELHCRIHPEAAKQDDPLLIAMDNAEVGTSEHNEAIERFAAEFDYLFKNAPKPPKRTVREKLFSWLSGRK